MVKKVVAKPLSKAKAAKAKAKEEQVQSLVLRQSYVPVEVDEKLRKLVQTRGVRMNELLRSIIEESVERMSADVVPFDIVKVPEPEIEFYVQEFVDGGWLNLAATFSEEDARDFIRDLDRSNIGEIRLVRASLEVLLEEETYNTVEA